MKKTLYTLMVTAAVIFSSHHSQAQAWEKSTKLLSLGVGPTHYWRFANGNGNGAFSRLTGQLFFEGEFGVHDYVGVGFTTGFGGAAGNNGHRGEFNIPAGVFANFHFFRLIDEKESKDLHSDKIDVYGGINLGTGLAVLYNPSEAAAMIFGGMQVGARYYFNPKIGVNLEVGYGKSILNAGVVFKLQ